MLVPLDGSPLAEEALRHAMAVFDCQITVLNVITPVDAGMSEGGILEPDDQRHEKARERTDKLITRFEERTDSEDHDVETVVMVGDPADMILEYVANHDMDQIVMGGHGGDQWDVTRRLLGTVSTVVVGEAPVTVTVV